MYTIDNGRLAGADWLASPNYNARPNGRIDAIIVHNISLPAGCFATGHIQGLFTNTLDCTLHPSYTSLAGVTVSAHLLISRQGSVQQFVNFEERAWHAGVSELDGETNCNDFSIGIELAGADDIAYSAQQYESLIEICRVLMQHYPRITTERIVGHCDIAPERKTDPGVAFDWSYFRARLRD